MKYSYLAYDLVIQSTFPLPELLETDGVPEVYIREGKVTLVSLGVIKEGSDFLVTDEGTFLFWENEGIFLVRGGKEIIVDPALGVNEKIIRLLTLGPAFAVLLHQRGLLALHAATVKICKGAVAIMGGSGCGKSALAATFYKRGYEIVADDVTAIQTDGRNGPLVFPGFPQLRLWPEVVSFLGDDPEKLPCLEPGIEKRSFYITYGFSQKPLPLRQIYLLNLNGDQTKEIMPLSPQEALVELIRHSYRISLLNGLQATLHLSQCASIVNNVPICRLSRPLSLSSLPDVVRMVEEDLANS